MLNGLKRSVYIVGIGGISLSAIAVILKSMGHIVRGSDVALSDVTDCLINQGIEVEKGHETDGLNDIDCMIVTAASSKNDPQVVFAQKKGIPIFSRADVLGMLSDFYKKTISIAGSHGKTTTTSMIACVFDNLSATVHVGGVLPKIGGNVKVGKSDIFITEACEYVDSFLSLNSYIGVVLNVQPDHLDYFGTISRLNRSFAKFAKHVKHCGALIVNSDDKRASGLECDCKKITFGIKHDANFLAKNIVRKSDGKVEFDCYHDGKFRVHVKLNVIGYHNVYNALATIAVARQFGIAYAVISEGLEQYGGVKRRFEFVSIYNGASVYNDYAHHPTEISAVIKTARKMCKGKLVVVFQPHTFSRTKSFYEKFAVALTKADSVILAKIYPAREKPIIGVTSFSLCKKVNELGGNAIYCSSFDCVIQKAKQEVRAGDMLLILGAGDVVQICKYFFDYGQFS